MTLVVFHEQPRDALGQDSAVREGASAHTFAKNWTVEENDYISVSDTIDVTSYRERLLRTESNGPVSRSQSISVAISADLKKENERTFRCEDEEGHWLVTEEQRRECEWVS